MINLYEALIDLCEQRKMGYYTHGYPSKVSPFIITETTYKLDYDSGNKCNVSYPNFGCLGKEGYVTIYDDEGNWCWRETFDSFDPIKKSFITYPITFLFACLYAKCVYGVET